MGRVESELGNLHVSFALYLDKYYFGYMDVKRVVYDRRHRIRTEQRLRSALKEGVIFMSLALLTPWQQLLWLVCAVILIVPVVVAGVNAVLRGYFRAKEEHTGRMAKAVANAINQIAKEANGKLDEVLKKIKEGQGLEEIKGIKETRVEEKKE